ncbi:class V chitinase-like protein [Apiospora sp. TS-2023a]
MQPGRGLQQWDGGPDTSSNDPCDLPRAAAPSSATSRPTRRPISPYHDVISYPINPMGKHNACHFTVETTYTNGNANFMSGGQDMIGIINNAIEDTGSSGKVVSSQELHELYRRHPQLGSRVRES